VHELLACILNQEAEDKHYEQSYTTALTLHYSWRITVHFATMSLWQRSEYGTIATKFSCNFLCASMASLLLKKEGRMDARCLVFAMLMLGSLSASGNPSVNNYDALRTAANSKCQSVDAEEYQSGLLFNPEGYRTYYAQSLCYQKAAITFRDIELCDLVKRRWALFSSSWGYSKSNCRKLVSEGIVQDREAIDRMKNDYERGHVVLAGFRIERI
jgi:hypothetical protein